jgi:hypothetical protein
MSIIAKILPLLNINDLDDIDSNVYDDKTKAGIMEIYVNDSKDIDYRTLAAVIYCCTVDSNNKLTYKEIKQSLLKPLPNNIYEMSPFVILLLTHMYFLIKCV